jgi:hypothetical protein
MIEPSPSVRAVSFMCLSSLITGCIAGQDVAVSEPSEVAIAEQEVAASGASKRHDIALTSDTNWDVYSSPRLERKAYLGNAQRVCSNATSPADCPAGAIDYGYGGTDWSARIEACEGRALWIWAPGITGASSPAELAEYYFVNHVSIPNRPSSAQVTLAVDDQAEVIVNGTAMGAIGSINDKYVAWTNQNKPTTINIASALVIGMNTITVRAANGSGAFTDCKNCTYQQNPAGVVFCVDIRF